MTKPRRCHCRMLAQARGTELGLEIGHQMASVANGQDLSGPYSYLTQYRLSIRPFGNSLG